MKSEHHFHRLKREDKESEKYQQRSRLHEIFPQSANNHQQVDPLYHAQVELIVDNDIVAYARHYFTC